MSKDEEYVRAHWEDCTCEPHCFTNTLRFLVRCGAYGNREWSSGWEQTGESAWSAAAEYTRERKEATRQLEEEIDTTRRIVEAADVAAKSSDSDIWANARDTHQRILARLESALADLKRGMR